MTQQQPSSFPPPETDSLNYPGRKITALKDPQATGISGRGGKSDLHKQLGLCETPSFICLICWSLPQLCLHQALNLWSRVLHEPEGLCAVLHHVEQEHGGPKLQLEPEVLLSGCSADAFTAGEDSSWFWVKDTA